MVKLTTKYLFRRISKKNQLQPRKKDETDDSYLGRLTHLHLQSQFIDKIAPIPECQSISVAYLQRNLLQTIHNMENFPNLTHLHLEHNYISKIENLSKLKFLRRLYLGYNEISVVEGLDGLDNLIELHLESQRLPQGETLYFDPRTISQLGQSLKVLNISNNNVSSIRCLGGLTSLTMLILQDNWVEDLDDVTDTISQLPVLEVLQSEGNPVANDRKYLDAVVLASKTLKTLNGKSIDDHTRVFITNLAHNKKKVRGQLSARVNNSVDERYPDSPGELQSRQAASEGKSRIGSKLFPILKKISQNSPAISKPSVSSSKGHQPSLSDSVKVTNVTSFTSSRF